MLRMDPALHASVVISAEAQGKSLNVWVQGALQNVLAEAHI